MKFILNWQKIVILLFGVVFLTTLANAQPRRSERKPPTTENKTLSDPATNKDTQKTVQPNPEGTKGSRMSATQQQNLQKLQADLAAIKEGSQVTQAQIDALAASLMAIAEGATKPSQESVQKLAEDLADALSDGTLSSLEIVKLTNDIQRVLNSANIPMSEVDQVIADAKAILAASNIDRSDIETIAGDLKAISSELQKNVTQKTTQIQSTPKRGRLKP